MLTQEEREAVVRYLVRWSTKAIFEDGVVEDDRKWESVEAFLKECGDALTAWILAKRESR